MILSPYRRPYAAFVGGEGGSSVAFVSDGNDGPFVGAAVNEPAQ